MKFLIPVLLFLLSSFLSKAQLGLLPKEVEKEIKKQIKLPHVESAPFIGADSLLSTTGQFIALRDTLPIKYIYYGRVNCCKSTGCSTDKKLVRPTQELYEYLDYMIFFTQHGKIASIKVYNYQASRGQQVASKSWLKQFIGYNGEKELRVGKEIDGISGATISVYALNNDIQEKTIVLQTLLSTQ